MTVPKARVPAAGKEPDARAAPGVGFPADRIVDAELQDGGRLVLLAADAAARDAYLTAALGREADRRTADEGGADERGAADHGANARGADTRSADTRSADARGADGRGAGGREGREPDDRAAGAAGSVGAAGTGRSAVAAPDVAFVESAADVAPDVAAGSVVAARPERPLGTPTDLRAADAASARRYLHASQAAGTRRAYESDLRAWIAWAEGRGVSAAFPADPTDVASWLASMADAGRSPKTITRRLSALNAGHRAAGRPRPGDAEIVRRTLRGIRTTAAAGGYAPRKAAALSTARVHALVTALPDGLAGLRDRCLILLGFSLGLRASDLCWLRVEDFTAVDGGLDVLLRHSKTDQQGTGVTLALAEGTYLATCPVRAVRAYRAALAERGVTTGPLFRSVHRGRSEALGRNALTTRSVGLILDRAATRAGIPTERLSSHSLRRGMATAAYSRGVEEAEISRTGRWTSLVVRQYDESDRWRNPSSARLGL